jgi:hypothetical protein
MCPYFVEKCCTLEPEKGEVKEPFPVYYCQGGLRSDSYLGCPVFQSKAEEKDK